MQDLVKYQGITFDDVLLEPALSDIIPADCDVRPDAKAVADSAPTGWLARPASFLMALARRV